MNNLFAPLIKREFWNGDCLELMRDIPDGSVDMILCDLPYGTTQNKWDSVIPFEPLWEQYWRVLKRNGAVVLTAQCPFDKSLGASQIQHLKYEWIWFKTQATGHLNAKKQPMKTHENVLVFYREQCVYNPQIVKKDPANIRPVGRRAPSDNYGKFNEYAERGIPLDMRYPKSIEVFPNTNHGERGLHPTQKPVALFEYLIKTYTNPGETVLDNCAGSGTTAIAALNCGRGYICIERDDEYYRRATERVKRHNG